MKTGPGVTWPNGDGVEQLPFGEPVQALHEIGPKEREEHVAAAEEHRADLGEDQKQRPEPERGCRRSGRRAGSGRQACRARTATPEPDPNARCPPGPPLGRHTPGCHREAGSSQHDEFVHAGHHGADRYHGQHGQSARLHRRSAEPPQRLDDDGDHDRLHTIENAGDFGEP